MSSKRTGPQPPAIVSARNRRNSRSSPWRKMIISDKSIKCREHFARLEAAGDSRRIPRPELDDNT